MHMTHFVRKLIVVCLPLFLLATWAMPAQAASGPKAKPHQPQVPLCVVHSNGPTVESGEGVNESSVADIIQVECRPIFSQNTVTIDGSQLFHQCQGRLVWVQPRISVSPGPQFTVQLDNDGNAIAEVLGGPSCAPATARIFASLNAPPFPTASTTFTVLPPQNTKPGVTATPRREVEDAVFSSVATVIQVEFPSSQAEKFVTIKSDEMAARCQNLLWDGFVGGIPATIVIGPEVTVQLDNNGNAFVVARGEPSCASGTSTITADLTTVPYTTFSTNFTILSPRPTI